VASPNHPARVLDSGAGLSIDLKATTAAFREGYVKGTQWVGLRDGQNNLGNPCGLAEFPRERAPSFHNASVSTSERVGAGRPEKYRLNRPFGSSTRQWLLRAGVRHGIRIFLD